MLPLEGSGPLGPLLPHDLSEIIMGIVLFLIVLAVVKTKVYPMFEATYAARTAAIEGGMEQANQAQHEAQQAKQKYEAMLAEAHGEAAQIRENAKNEGAQIVADMRGQAQEESDRIKSSAHLQIEAERQQALTSLRREVGGLATGLAGKIVGESLSDDERSKRTIDRFLDELEAQSAHAEQRA